MQRNFIKHATTLRHSSSINDKLKKLTSEFSKLNINEDDLKQSSKNKKVELLGLTSVQIKKVKLLGLTSDQIKKLENWLNKDVDNKKLLEDELNELKPKIKSVEFISEFLDEAKSLLKGSSQNHLMKWKTLLKLKIIYLELENKPDKNEKLQAEIKEEISKESEAKNSVYQELIKYYHQRERECEFIYDIYLKKGDNLNEFDFISPTNFKKNRSRLMELINNLGEKDSQ
nr:8731_t:CDS:2 [Entrophospora candida]